MSLKSKSPLQLAQKELEDIGKQVDRLVKNVKNQATTIEDASRKCQELQILVEKTQFSLKKLTKADEPAPVRNYDQRKQEKEMQLQSILERLNNLSLELSPPGPSTTTDSLSTEDSETDKEENSSDEDSSEDGDDDEDEKEKRRAMKPPSHSTHSMYVVLCDFKAEEEGDLSVQRGQRLRIIRKTKDGWWLAQDVNGNRGVVPKNFLKTGSVDEDNEDEVDESDDDEESDEEELQDNEEVIHDKDNKSASHGKWSIVRKALTEIDTTDVLSAMGAIPAGFRPSTLTKLLVEEGEKYRGSHYIRPELSQSQLSFKDLFLDAGTGRVRAREVRICVCFTLWNCMRIPTPGVGVQVLSRHIRLCAFDGTQVLSNIHTVRAAYNVKNPKTWSFSPRMAGNLPTLMDGDCFLRCTSASPNLGILFELGVTFKRHSTGERGDLSCGWAFLKLTDDAGNPLRNKMYDLPVKGGTPFEEDVPLDPTIARGSAGSVFQQLLQTRRQPKLMVKLKSTNNQTRTQLDLLPDNLLHCLSCVHLLAFHRQLLADTLLIDRPTIQNADLICSPILSTFPVLLEQTDLMDVLRCAWMDAVTNMSRAQKRDSTFLKHQFAEVYMSSVYFLLHSPSLPAHRWADQLSEEQRARAIYSTVDALKTQRRTGCPTGGLEVYVSPSYSHLAFDVSELTFDLLGQ